MISLQATYPNGSLKQSPTDKNSNREKKSLMHYQFLVAVTSISVSCLIV